MSNSGTKKRQLIRLLKGAYLFGRRYYYKGNTVECPLCNHGFRKMLPGGFQSDITDKLQIIGAGYRMNNICPSCLSTDRDRLVYLYLKNIGQIFEKSLNVLHVSPEPSLYRILKKIPNLNYTIGTKYAEGAYYPAEISFFDLLALPYPDHTFDVVIVNHVLEHIDDDRQAMSEIFRVLKPKAYAILQVPISNNIEKTIEDQSITEPAERHKAFGQFDHVRIYGPDYKQRLENVGFQVVLNSPFKEDWKLKNIDRYALNNQEKLFVAHKPMNKNG